MRYVEPSELDRVKQIDLLSYLEKCEPDELVRLGSDTCTTKTHDSLMVLCLLLILLVETYQLLFVACIGLFVDMIDMRLHGML